MQITEKIDRVTQEFGLTLQRGREPSQSIDVAFKVRNFISHPKEQELEWEDGDGTEIPDVKRLETSAVLVKPFRLKSETDAGCVHFSETSVSSFASSSVLSLDAEVERPMPIGSQSTSVIRTEGVSCTVYETANGPTAVSLKLLFR